MDLTKKTILITGASSGIGKLTAIYFADNGWNVAATMRKPQNENVLNTYENIKVFHLDVIDPKSIDDAIKETIKHFGQIDVLFNNAGIGVVGPFEAMTLSQIENQFGVNVFGVMNTTRAILPYFREQKKGMIINTSSIGGLISFPLFSTYNSTKWALEGFMDSLQYELKHFNIQIKTIQPGPLRTNFEDSTIYVNHPQYSSYTTAIRDKVNENFSSSPNAKIVAEKVFDIATSFSNKMRFPIGLQAKMTLFLKWLIPNHWFISLLRFQLEKEFKK